MLYGVEKILATGTETLQSTKTGVVRKFVRKKIRAMLFREELHLYSTASNGNETLTFFCWHVVDLLSARYVVDFLFLIP
jgi:hypothetical protein